MNKCVYTWLIDINVIQSARCYRQTAFYNVYIWHAHGTETNEGSVYIPSGP